MDFGVFQLLPRGRAASDREVIEQGLWEVDFAERNGFESVWIAEHHFSGFGLAGAPSVYAAAIAQRTRRIRIGYGVAVVPLHQPLRLAEEISWVDHLSEGRVMVGVGPGFMADEFAGFGVPLDERHARLAEGFDIVRRALAESIVRPEPYTRPHPPFYWASSSDEAMRRGFPLLLGTKPIAEIAERLDRYREIRNAPSEAIEREIGEMYILRRVTKDIDEELETLGSLGLRKVIAWFHDAETSHASVRRSMERFVASTHCRAQTRPLPQPTGTGTASSTAPPPRLCSPSAGRS